MDFKRLLATTSLSLLAWQAPTALAADFDGLYGQAGIGFVKGKSNPNFEDWFNVRMSEKTTVGQLGFGYSHSFGELNLAGSINYLVGNQPVGSTTQDFDEVETGNTFRQRMNHTWSFTLEPGLYISPSTLFYSKLGYHRSSGKWNFERPFHGDSYRGSKSFSGRSIGVGIKKSFAPNLYAYVELERAYFGREELVMNITTDGVTDTYVNSIRPRILTGLVGIGYSF